MPKFAVYYVPDPEEEFYRLGSVILGYDVWKREITDLPDHLAEKFSKFENYNNNWIKYSRPYGFHLTIGDAINYDPENLNSICEEVEGILSCFDPDKKFILTRKDSDFVSFWPVKEGFGVVLRYDPNEYLNIFHAVISTRIHSLGFGSVYTEDYELNPDLYTGKPHIVNKVRKFFSPTILDSYKPHFTLLNPYPGKFRENLSEFFTEIFGKFQKISINSICLLLQMSEKENWFVHRKFPR